MGLIVLMVRNRKDRAKERLGGYLSGIDGVEGELTEAVDDDMSM